MATTTTLNSSAAISQYWKKIALDKLEAETHLYKMSWKNEVPSGNGKIINWVRFPLASADTTPAVEGSPVAPETLSSTNFNATMQQYVAAVSFSDVLQEETFVEGGMEEQAATFIAQKLKYTIDALCRAEINSTTVTAGSNLLAPLSVSGGAISSIVAGSTLTSFAPSKNSLNSVSGLIMKLPALPTPQTGKKPLSAPRFLNLTAWPPTFSPTRTFGSIYKSSLSFSLIILSSLAKETGTSPDFFNTMSISSMVLVLLASATNFWALSMPCSLDILAFCSRPNES